MLLEHILLEQEQKDLLSTFVEASRNVPRGKREKFLCIGGIVGMEYQSTISHPGLLNGEYVAYDEDVEMLGRNFLVECSDRNRGSKMLHVTPLGFQYYEKIKAESAETIQHIEDTVSSYLHSYRFQRKYAIAYEKWSEAEKMLWSTDSIQQLTMMGHLCREAIQEFVSVLVETYRPKNVTNDPAKTVARLKAIISIKFHNDRQTERAFLDALICYWGTLSDLIQRQEHDSQKEGQSLVWEDGRRVIFHTAIVMFEIDKSLSSKQDE